MNRRERKHMEKQLGLQKYYKTESREKKWERWRSNQENGNRIMEDRKKEIGLAQQEAEEQRVSDVIARNAEEIAKEKKIPIIDAMVEAQEEYQNRKV